MTNSNTLKDKVTSIYAEGAFPASATLSLLALPHNTALREYVTNDAFGAHVFPGDTTVDHPDDFFKELNSELANNHPIHLWLNLPFCEKRCFFCQFPIAITRNKNSILSSTQKWLDANLKEASLWLKAVPHLKTVPIGEFNILGGTPTLLSSDQLVQLLDFYTTHFHFNDQTTIRIEGTASTYTLEKLKTLRKLGISKVSAGIQSFNDAILAKANCVHTGKESIDYIQNAHALGFKAVNADFIYGLANQSVAQFLKDIQTAIDLHVSCIVITKLHLKTFAETRTAISGEKEALWQNAETREKLTRLGHSWPTLEEQYQMREQAVSLLTQAGYTEHPTMYFYHPDKTPEKWKSLMVDQDKQYPEIGFGMGANSKCTLSEAINATTSADYFAKLEQGIIPIESTKRFSETALVNTHIKLALSSCEPLRNDLFQQRFPHLSLFDGKLADIFKDLEKRELLTLQYEQQTIQLTSIGLTLVEAIMHTEFA